MTARLHWVDCAILFLYFAAVFAIGFFRSRTQGSSEVTFLLAGRKLTLIPLTASLVTTWYGGILGVGEFTFQHGIASWLAFGIPYYLAALLYAKFVAGRVRSDLATTIPDRFRACYGPSSGVMAAAGITALASPAPYLLSIAMIIQLVLGFGLIPALLLAAALSLAYPYVGGLRSVIWTDLLHFALMFAGFGVLVAHAAAEFGGFASLAHSLPPTHLNLTGRLSPLLFAAWFFIALWTFIDPGFYQRCAAAASPRTATLSVTLAVIFWIAFDALSISSALFARAMLPDTSSPMLATSEMGMRLLGPGLRGLFLVGLLSSVMAAADSAGFISAQTFGRDLVGKIFSVKSGVWWTRLGLIVTSMAAVILAWRIPSVVRLWYALGSVVIPGLLLPFLFSFGSTRPRVGAVFWMVVPSAISLGWLWSGTADAQSVRYPLGIDPFLPGLAASLLGWGIWRVARSWRESGGRRG